MNLDLRGKKALVCGSTQGISKPRRWSCPARRDRHPAGAERIGPEEKPQRTFFGLSPEMITWSPISPDPTSSGIPGALHAPGRHRTHPGQQYRRTSGGAITEAKTEEFTQAFSNHLVCNHILSQAVLPGMKDAGYGRIINVISTSVKQPLKGLGVSNTVRAARPTGPRPLPAKWRSTASPSTTSRRRHQHPTLA